MACNVRTYQTACSRTAGHRISEKGEGFAAVTLGLEVGCMCMWVILRGGLGGLVVRW